MKRWMITTVLGCFLTLPAMAEPPESAPREPAALQVLRAARNKGKKPATPPPHGDATLGHPDDGAKHAAIAAMHVAARRAKRDHARRERHKELRAKLKNRDVPAPVRVELRTHARRISRLRRIAALAEDDAALIARVEALVARENTRHERQMAVLLARVAQAPNRSDDEQEQDDEVAE